MIFRIFLAFVLFLGISFFWKEINSQKDIYLIITQKKYNFKGFFHLDEKKREEIGIPEYFPEIYISKGIGDLPDDAKYFTVFRYDKKVVLTIFSIFLIAFIIYIFILHIDIFNSKKEYWINIKSLPSFPSKVILSSIFEFLIFILFMSPLITYIFIFEEKKYIIFLPFLFIIHIPITIIRAMKM